MKYRKLGSSGLMVSEIALGSWLTFGDSVDQAQCSKLVRLALDQGINLIDTADVYARGEAEIALAKALASGPRKDYVLASKCYFPTGVGANDRGLSRKHIFESLHASLARLETEYLDLYQCHRFDEDSPISETVRAMDDLIRQGKVLYTAGCNFEAWRFVDAYSTSQSNGLESFAASQFAYSMMARSAEAEMIPACRQLGIAVIPYLPLAAGMLTGKVDAGGSAPPGTRLDIEKSTAERWITPGNLALINVLDNWAKERGHSVLELAFAWLLAEPIIATVIAGAGTPGQVGQNAAAAEWRLTPGERAAVTAILDANPPDNAGDYYSSAEYLQRPTEMAPRENRR